MDCKTKILIIIIGIALLIPSYLGMAATRINYDVLSYLPDTLETVDGQDIMVDQFDHSMTNSHFLFHGMLYNKNDFQSIIILHNLSKFFQKKM